MTFEHMRSLGELTHEQALEIDWERSGVPRRFRDFRLETSPVRETMPELVAKLLRARGSWYLWGDFGVGKTGLAAGYARKYLESGCSVMYRKVPDLLTELRSTYGDAPFTEHGLLKLYGRVDLLVLDDLGVEQDSGSGWLGDRLYQIIGGRHDEMKDTVFTSNLPIDQLAERLNGRDRYGQGERIVWMIAEVTKDRIVEVKGPNLRSWR